MKSLEKGNLHAVTFQRDGKEEKMFLEANPKDRNVIVYDSAMKKQFQGVKEHKGEKSDMKESNGQEQSSQKQKSEKSELKEEPEGKRKGKRMSV